MTCRIVRVGGATAIVCSRRERRRKCKFCDRPADKLCDHPKGAGTCDAPLCDRHAVAGGPDVDYCPDHPPQQARLL